MKKIWAFVMLLLAVGIIAGLFGPPMQGQGVRAATLSDITTEVYIYWLSSPPEKMCKDDKAAISFEYTILRSAAGKYIPNTSGASGNLTAAGTLGTLDESSWPMDPIKPAGTISTVYTAEEAGHGQISIGSDTYSVTEKNSFPFDVEECDRNIVIGASDYRSGLLAEVDTELEGKGVIAIDSKSGVVTGRGTYQYRLTVTFQNPAPSYLTCDPPKKGSGDSDFVIVNAYLAGVTLVFDIEFTQVRMDPISFKCVDARGVTYDYEAFPGGDIDPNPDLNLKKLVFGPGVNNLDFAFGKGWGIIWLVKRKGKGK
jgi:hypothetical protein